ncbi:MAG TPA: hypothetical protein VMT87_03185 [Vicinamibacteria bacterium]|nr:hypothetical protein [Vicinamibacteria bacterium]
MGRTFEGMIAAALLGLPGLTAGVLAAAPDAPPPPLAADYEVTARPGARELRVEATLAPRGAAVVLEEGLGPFVAEAEVDDGRGWRAAQPRGDTLPIPGCAARPCRVRYTVKIADAALALRDRNRALYHTGSILAPPASWLARPPRPRPGDRFRFRVRMPRGWSFVTGVSPSPSGRGFEGALGDLPLAPYSGFGRFETASVRAGEGRVELAIAPGQRALDRAAIVDWAERAARAVSGVYGRLPLPRVAVLVLPGGRRPVGFGTTLGHGGASIMVWLGAQATEEDLRRDWVLTHEMAHLGLPNLPRAQRWLEEGLATYLEPVARARAGQITPEEAWGGFVSGLPRGLPRAGDGGLDGTRSWGRTYWGGALYYLLADLEIRERTGNRRSLDDALRGIVADGGTIAVRWSAARALEAGDRATGVDVLQRLHARLGSSADHVDLDALWARLGVRRREGGIVFDDGAPLAAIRRSLMADSLPAVERRVLQVERLLQARLDGGEIAPSRRDVLLRAPIRVHGEGRGDLDHQLAGPCPRDLQAVRGQAHAALHHVAFADQLEEHAEDPRGRPAP